MKSIPSVDPYVLRRDLSEDTQRSMADDCGMKYTGHVAPGGPAAIRYLTGLTVHKLSVGPMDNNTYLLRDNEAGTQLLIDAAAEPGRILELVGPRGLAAIVTTHCHQDHWGALAEVREATGAPVLAHAADAAGIGVETDRVLDDGETISFGTSRLSVMSLRGHTEGSIALTYLHPDDSPQVFTGDSLFPGGVGMTRSPADFVTLLNDVTEKLFNALPDSTWVYPGHGDDTMLGRERPHLPEWRDRGW